MPEVVVEKRLLKNFVKFIEKHMSRGLFFHSCWPEACNSIKKENSAKVFLVYFAKFLRAPSLTEHHQWLLLSRQVFICWGNIKNSNMLGIEFFLVKFNCFLHKNSLSWLAFICSRSIMWNTRTMSETGDIDIVLVSSLTLRRFYTLFLYIHCWLWTSKCLFGSYLQKNIFHFSLHKSVVKCLCYKNL